MREIPHIQVESLGFQYRGHRDPVLSAITFDVRRGQAIAVVGRSGSGKTTLLHLLAGLIRPNQGTIEIDGKPVDGPSPHRVMMFQQPLLYPWMTVRENAVLGLRFAGKGSSEKSAVAATLEMLGLAEFVDTNVQRLSGGQQQRVALARSLMTKPNLLLLDEPFSALDALTRQDLQQQVRSMTKALGITLILVTHDIDEAVRMADRALVMGSSPGRVLEDIAFSSAVDAGRAIQGSCADRARVLAVLGESSESSAIPFRQAV